MTETSNERRRFSRAHIDAQVEISQGAISWSVELIDVSLAGLAVSLPADWDADYAQSFTAEIKLNDGVTIELYAHLVHVDENKLGFQCEHVDRENIGPLITLLSEKLGEDLVQREVELLDS